jgi:fluoride exporter
MQKILLVLLGGALGTGLRYGLSTLITSVFRQPEFPYGTFIINMTGSFAIGILASLFAARPAASEVARAALMTGVLGGYTTFSSFSLESYTLLREGRADLAILYACTSLLLGLAAVWLGMRFAQIF